MLAVIKRYPDHVSANFRQHPTQRARPTFIQSSEQTSRLIRLDVEFISFCFVLFTFLNQEKFQRFSGFLLREKLKYPDDQITKVKNLKSREIDCFSILSVVLSINLSIYLEIYSVANQSSDKGKLKISQCYSPET